MALSTDFKDDILNESVNEKRKYQMTYNDDGTVSFTDVTSYSQTGSEYGAAEVNEERQAINELSSDLKYERITGSNYYLCRIGDVKFYNYSGAIPEKWTGNLQFQMRETLPVAFRPKNAVSTGVVMRSGVTGILDISTSGIIKVNPSEDIPQGNWVMFSVCYI